METSDRNKTFHGVRSDSHKYRLSVQCDPHIEKRGCSELWFGTGYHMFKYCASFWKVATVKQLPSQSIALPVTGCISSLVLPRGIKDIKERSHMDRWRLFSSDTYSAGLKWKEAQTDDIFKAWWVHCPDNYDYTSLLVSAGGLESWHFCSYMNIK